MTLTSGGLGRVVAKAERIFRDELRHGCHDRLVHGGLTAFLGHWVQEARTAGLPVHILDGFQQVAATLDHYGSMEPTERKSRLERAIALLQATGRPVQVTN